VFDAAGVDIFAGHPLQAFPHLSESLSQQHRQFLEFLTAPSSSSVSLLTHHQQHQPELLLSALRDIRRPPGSNIGALFGVALSSSCASLPKYLEHRLDSYSSLGWNPLIENMFSTYSPLELNQHRMLLSSDSDTNELSAPFGIALSFMSSRIHSSLCSSPPLSIDAISSTLFGWPLQNRHASVKKVFTYS